MARSKRPARVKPLNPDRPTAADEDDTPPPLDDTSYADANLVEHDDDARAPLNPEVHLKLVSSFRLSVRRFDRSGSETRETCVDPRLRADSTQDEIVALFGEGRYFFTWYCRMKPSKGPLKQRVYRRTIFTGRLAAGAGATPAATANGASTSELTTLVVGERLLPANMSPLEQIVWSFIDRIEAHNERTTRLAEALGETLTAVTQRASESAASATAMAGTMATAMRAMGQQDLESRTNIYGQLIDAKEAAATSGLIANIVAPAAKRVLDRALPEGAAGQQQAQVANIYEEMKGSLDGLKTLAAQAPQITAGMAEMGAMGKRLAKFEKALTAAGMMPPEEPESEAAAETPAADPPPEPTSPVPDAPIVAGV